MTDKCLICLSDSNEYLTLSSCSCKMVLHEDCFIEYSYSINNIKCVICNKEYKEYTHNLGLKNLITHKVSSFIYSLFFLLQNFYFYIDEKIFPQRSLLIRTIFAVVFHCILILAIMIPYVIYTYTIYIILFFRKTKPYKVYNL